MEDRPGRRSNKFWRSESLRYDASLPLQVRRGVPLPILNGIEGGSREGRREHGG